MPFTKTAIVTGACSGIGLALTRRLLAKDDETWRVVLADIRPKAYEAIASSLDPARAKFVETNVADWDSNARLFKAAYEWDDAHRIDFLAANAGTGDKEMVAQQFDLDAEPTKPDLTCFEVNVSGVLYGLKLFIHYARKTQRDMAAKDSSTSGNASDDQQSFNPKVVITASCTAQYPFPVAPHYVASKSTLLGLTRAVGPWLLKSDNIAVNCVMPGYCATNLTPIGLNDAWPQHWITPVESVVRAFEELAQVDGKVAADGKSDGKDGVVKAGQAVEVVIDKLYYRDPVPYPHESQRFLIDESLTEDGLWWSHVQRAIRETGSIGVSR